MKIAGIAMIRNEHDIVEAFIRHNLRYIDHLYIIDHNSFDGTSEILSLLKQENLPITVYNENELGFSQAERINELCDKVFQLYKPNYIFALDCDEFIVVSNKKHLEKELINLPDYTFGLIPWKTYVWSRHCVESNNVLSRITCHRETEKPQYNKVVIPSFFISDTKFRITEGNHDVIHDKNSCSHQLLKSTYLAHFPVRSKNQIISKILLGWLSMLMRDVNAGTKSQGYHWRDIYMRILENGDLSDEDVENISKYYAYKGDKPIKVVNNPLQVSFELKYTHYKANIPLKMVTKLAEKFIMQRAGNNYTGR